MLTSSSSRLACWQWHWFGSWQYHWHGLWQWHWIHKFWKCSAQLKISYFWTKFSALVPPCPLQLPTFGYLWGTSIPWFKVHWGYPFQLVISFYGIVEWPPYSIPELSRTIPYSWNCLYSNTSHTTTPYHHTIPIMPHHGWHRVARVLYSTFQNISAGC